MSVINSRVINLEELKLEHLQKGSTFETYGVRIAPLLGGKELGYSYRPGAARQTLMSFSQPPRRIRAGDVICCPTGGPETAHQIINDSDRELEYFVIADNHPADVTTYPRTDKRMIKPELRCVREDRQGQMHARISGVRASRADVTSPPTSSSGRAVRFSGLERHRLFHALAEFPSKRLASN